MKRVCVIGAGSAGLCVARYLARQPELFTVCVFEQSSNVGGTWVYTDAVGADENGRPIHSSMYRNLRTNLPKEVMAFPDFPFPSDGRSFLRHDEVRRYLEDYAKHFDLYKNIEFNTEVERVHPVKVTSQDEESTWEVTVRELKKGVASTALFDAVVVCNGHYSEPLIPEIPGLASFPGLVMHSHSYRHAEVFRDMTVVVLGAQASGNDIGLDIAGTARRIYLSHSKGTLSSKYPERIEQVSAIQTVSADGTIQFESGEQCKADAILFCTGYKHSFPFLSEECKTMVENNRVTPVYKHVFHSGFSGSLSFLGLCFRVCPFPLFSVQARFVVSIISGSKSLPSKKEMECDTDKDFQERIESGLPVRHAHLMGDRQWRYNDQLAELADCEKIDPVVVDLYNYVGDRRKFHVATYKNDDYRLTAGTWENGEATL